MRYEYAPRGVCANKIEFEIDGGKVANVNIIGGCPGNGKGIARLVEGADVNAVIEKLENIRCGGRSSSCPAQLAAALKEAVLGKKS
ncbi:MAG: TIGR03905 family TSCPD domain-containing protein [Oscillospiraceae bacterium]|jgi:uncharacterized protein (TIGR03905 family)|nr:TIGR03905 family TSCPD domain-containing protein [Oscillospiraceae bacterium]